MSDPDPRPRPQYGEYASPEEQRARIAKPDVTDALSTGVFVLGVEEGLALVNRQPDIEAVIIDSNGRMHFSAGLEMLGN